MQIPDLINGGFQLGASLFIFNHCRVLFKDKHVQGVSIVSTVFFLVFGLFNLYYFRSLKQPFSVWCGVAAISGNLLWTYMMIYYRKFPGGRHGKTTEKL